MRRTWTFPAAAAASLVLTQAACDGPAYGNDQSRLKGNGSDRVNGNDPDRVNGNVVHAW